MAIDFDKFLNWAESRFGDVKVSGSEIKVNSIFEEDYKHHLWCNPYGGKKGLPNGVFHCWKSGRDGSLITLVMKVDKCDYDHALAILGIEEEIGSLADQEAKVNALFDAIYNAGAEPVVMPTVKNQIEFPESTFWIKDLPSDDFWKAEAEIYLQNRKLPPNDYLICTEGDYANRIIIPYFDRTGSLIYWNGRFLNDSKYIPKYLGPHKDVGVGKSDVIYVAGPWQNSGRIHLTEGEFDAKSLHIAGLYAGALGGKSLEEKQLSYLQGLTPVLCFDTDKKKKTDFGGVALLQVGLKLMEEGFREVFFVRPPTQFKDWNEMLVKVGPKLISTYIQNNTTKLTHELADTLKSNLF